MYHFLAIIGESHVMGWGLKAIEIRAVENGQLDGVFMHKRTQKLRFLCERNDKVWIKNEVKQLMYMYMYIYPWDQIICCLHTCTCT